MSWQRRILRVNLSEGRAQAEPLNMEWARDFLGERGLATVIEVLESERVAWIRWAGAERAMWRAAHELGEADPAGTGQRLAEVFEAASLDDGDAIRATAWQHRWHEAARR